MAFSATTATKKILNLKKRIRAIPGGTSASKTISILLVLIDKAQTDKTPTLTSIVSESIPHLRKGCIRDFKNIMKAHYYWKEESWKATELTYTFETGSQIEFFGADQPEKLRGGRRDRLFVNEANNISLQAFEELEVRTKEFIFLDWNPTNEFWYYTDLKPERNDIEELTLTYLDNEALDSEIIKSIEQRKHRRNWWLVYGLGQLGELEERIYKDWQIIDEIPHEARLFRYGVDFGFTNDPTVIVAIYEYNGGYIIDEITYQKGLSNKTIADILNSQPKTLTIADSAEPKSIDEIYNYGVNIIGAEKGPGSVYQGIQYVQGLKISVTKRSVGTIKAYRNYCFFIDKNGKVTNDPDDSVHEWSNPMDAIRYGFNGKIVSSNITRPQYNLNKPNYR